MNLFLRCTLPVLLLLAATCAQCAVVSLAPDLQTVTWIDNDGSPLRLSQLAGRKVVLTMAYTACRRVCATTTLVLQEMQRLLDARGITAEFVVVSYDPSNDAPADWTDFRKRRGLTRANWHFLTGDERTTHQMARALDLNFWSYHEHLVHDFRIVLLDEVGRASGEIVWEQLGELPRALDAALTGAQ